MCGGGQPRAASRGPCSEARPLERWELQRKSRSLCHSDRAPGSSRVGAGCLDGRRGSPQFGLRDNRDTLGPILPAPRPVVCQDGRAPPSPMGAFQSPAFARFISAGTPRVGGPAATGRGAARGWPAGLCPGPQRPALRASPAGPLRSRGCCWRRARPAQCRDGHAPDPSGRLGWSRDKVFSHRSVNKPEVL